MKNYVEMIAELRYKLRIFGVPIDGSTDIFCELISTVKKKYQAYRKSKNMSGKRTSRILLLL